MLMLEGKRWGEGVRCFMFMTPGGIPIGHLCKVGASQVSQLLSQLEPYGIGVHPGFFWISADLA